MKKLFILFILAGSGIMAACQQNTIVAEDAKSELNAQLDIAIARAGEQYQYMMERLPESRFPKTYHAKEDRIETSDSEWWCSGFYPGSLLYLYDKKGEETLKTEARRIMEVLEKEQYNTTTHDLGFMMFCSFGNALDIAPKDGDRDILVQSAKSLSTRFDEKTGVIKSWDSKDSDFLVIIDNMMNLELLFWATQETGDSTYYDIAITHADNTTKNHFRDDYSSYHVVNYNPKTGGVKEKRTAQGYADDSAWARGQAWGLYGYIVMYRFTKDQKYLDQAVNIAEFILNHPNMPEDKIPYWDFDAPNIPDALRDSSAGAILASALLELSGYVGDDKSNRYIRDAETMLASLASPTYLAATGTNGGFLLKHGVGHLPDNTEVDTPLTYGDYYFIEAIRRFKALYDH